MDVVPVAARLAQFIGAVTLFGTPLFFLYGLPACGPGAASGLRWARPLLLTAAAIVLLAALVALAAQTAAMAGEPSAALDPATIAAALTTQFGLGIAVRVGAAAAAVLAAAALRPGRGAWIALAGLGAVALASFAWTGHGAADEGWAGGVHLAADVAHLLAAGAWLGALVVFAALLWSAHAADATARLQALHRGLAGFAGVGSAAVAVLIGTGAVNGIFLVGPGNLGALATTAYGLLLVAKLVLFAGMLGLAAANRFRHTPALASGLGASAPGPALGELRRSVFLETLVALGVLVVVSWLGTLEPPAAMD